MISYNARAHVRSKLDLDDAMDALDGYHPAIGAAPGKQWDVTITLPAETLRQAATTAIAVLEQQLAGEVTVIEVMTTATFDIRHGLEPVPDLVSVTEAAAELGISRQAVVKRLEAGTMPGTKVGATWVIPQGALRRP